MKKGDQEQHMIDGRNACAPRALGNNRNNGVSLGAFTLNVNNGLANSNGNNWRSRATSLFKIMNTTHAHRLNRTPHKGPCFQARAIRAAWRENYMKAGLVTAHTAAERTE